MKFILCFIIGGLFCVIAQILIDKTALTPARILVLYVVSGVILTGIGIYKPLVEIAGCGATVPLTGFGYCLADGVEKAVNEHGFIGVFTGGITATSGGIASAILSSVTAALFFNGKPENL